MHMDDSQLRIKRILLGLSQHEIARRVGRSAAWISLVERGYVKPKNELREKIRKALNRNG